MTLLQKIRSLLTRRDKKILIGISVVTIIVSILEVANLSFIMLFISIITNFKALPTNKYVLSLQKYTGVLTNSQIIFLFGSFLIAFFAFRCLTNLIYIYGLQSFLERRRHTLTFRFFQNYLHFDYQKFAQKNPASISKLVFADTNNLMIVIAASIVICAEAFTLSLIYLSLLYINWKMTCILTFALCTKVFFILKTFSKRLTIQGAKTAIHTKNIGKIYNESFRNFKLIKLLGHESYILSRFADENRNLIKASILRKVLLETPRLILETIGFVILVGAVMYVVYKIATPEYVIPILSMYALAFYRFMPSITKIMGSYNNLTFAKAAIDLSDDLMYKTEEFGSKPVNFENEFKIENLSFGYKKEKTILKDVSLTIGKRERIAFIGESGAGKSTLADIIMGFYLPKEGRLLVDNQKLTTENVRAWRNKIGYIPQQIYLFDDTVAQNVILGRKYDEQKIISALKKANIYEFLLEKDGLETKVGEGGILLSGGQMQRIAIARALYSDPDILVLDEATSALDNETESKIMDEIYDLHKDKTLIIIAHRLTTVLRCQKIYKIEDKKLKLVESRDLIKKYIKTSQENSKAVQQGA